MYEELVIAFVVGSVLVSVAIAILTFRSRAKLAGDERTGLYVACVFGALAAVGTLVSNQQVVESLTAQEPDTVPYTADEIDNIDGGVNYDILSDVAYENRGTVTVDLSKEPNAELINWAKNNSYEVFRRQDIFLVEIKVRKKGDKKWMPFIEADVGDTLEFQMHYDNTTADMVNDVAVRTILPENIQYVPESETLYNSNYLEGCLLKGNDLFTPGGINIGNYGSNADAYVRFEGVVGNVSLVEGVNQIQMVAAATVNGKSLANSVSVYVKK